MITDQGCGFSWVICEAALKIISRKNYRNILGYNSTVETHVCSFPEGLLKRIHLYAYISSDPEGTFANLKLVGTL